MGGLHKQSILAPGLAITYRYNKKGDNTNKYVLYVTRKEVVEDDSNTFEEKFKTDEESNIINKTIIYAFIVIIAFTIIIIGFIKIKDKNRKK